MAYDKNMTPKLIAEFIGTLALIYIGVLAITNGAGSLTTIAFAHGLTIAVMVSATMFISGGHLNPAVTFGAWMGKAIAGRDALFYVGAQLAGGAVGAFLASVSLPDVDLAAGTPALAAGVSPGIGILVEAILTFFLVFVVFGTGIDSRFGGRIGGLAIGFTVALGIMAGGPITGAAMNPSRWFGPALVANFWDNALVYIAGPLAGGAIAGFVYSHFLAAKKTGIAA